MKDQKVSIEVYRKPSGLRFRLKSQNGEVVASSSKGYSSPEELADVLGKLDHLVWETFDYEFSTDKGKKVLHSFKAGFERPKKLNQVLRSEHYASKQKADQGIAAAKECIAIGLLTNLSSESSEVAHLSDKDAVLRVLVGVAT